MPNETHDKELRGMLKFSALLDARGMEFQNLSRYGHESLGMLFLLLSEVYFILTLTV